MSLFDKIKKGLTKTKNAFTGTIDSVLAAFGVIDDDLFDELEEALILADIGVDASGQIIEQLRDYVKENKIKDPAQIKDALKEILEKLLVEVPNDVKLNTKPSVVLLIGVNGVPLRQSLQISIKARGKK